MRINEVALARALTTQERIAASDGYLLAADRFRALTAPRGFIVMAGAIGVPQRFYRHFASSAQSRGYEVFTFDYRGIARSAPRTLRGFRMDIREWGALDLAAILDAAAAEAAWYGVPLYVVGHSFGGHAFGMTPNHARVRACFTYGTGAGWHGWMPRSEQVRVLALWNLVGPPLTWWKGFLPWKSIGMGEDLPADAYHQWRRWCRYPHYFFDDPEIGREMRASFAKVKTPLLAASATDDRWSPPQSRDAFLTGYTNAPIRRLNLNPRDIPLGSLGHMGFFRSRASILWPQAFEWLESV